MFVRVGGFVCLRSVSHRCEDTFVCVCVCVCVCVWEKRAALCWMFMCTLMESLIVYVLRKRWAVTDDVQSCERNSAC